MHDVSILCVQLRIHKVCVYIYTVIEPQRYSVTREGSGREREKKKKSETEIERICGSTCEQTQKENGVSYKSSHRGDFNDALMYSSDHISPE